MPDNMRRIEEWAGKVMRASAMQVTLCDGDDGTPMIGVNLYAANGDAFAHGHMNLDIAERFLADYADAVAALREQLGRKPQ